MASTNYYGGGGGGAAQTKMADYGYGDDDPYSFGGFSAVNQQSAAPGVDNDTQRRRSPTGNGKHLLPPRARQFPPSYVHTPWLGSRVVSVLDSGAEGPGFKS